ncbi:MAG: Gfo/Idh/MocA family oxidoreductase [Elusimicrobiota bacterium]
MVNIGMVGIGGYAGAYLNTLEQLEKKGVCRLHAIVIRNPKKYEWNINRWQLNQKNINIYSTIDEMVAANGKKISIIALPVGIPSHMPMSIQCMQAGYNVICEKPPAATIQDIDAMIECSNKTRTLLASRRKHRRE